MSYRNIIKHRFNCPGTTNCYKNGDEFLETSTLKFCNNTDSYQWQRSFCSIHALRNVTNAVCTSSLLIYFGIYYVLDSMTRHCCVTSPSSRGKSVNKAAFSFMLLRARPVTFQKLVALTSASGRHCLFTHCLYLPVLVDDALSNRMTGKWGVEPIYSGPFYKQYH